ncbi:MAG: formate--phosphoribosylaminoimidazolecarboxamide ligase [Euryarchaeota archaeon]|nr:formate--phosphoribosylaminoimidazolecarboxamide ligase [Euryarchaeota archaeon]
MDVTIGTIGSHSALQILHGAKLEGFRTLLITTPNRVKLYKSFNIADEILTVNSFNEILDIEEELLEKNVVLIPHGSFVEYIGSENIKKLKVPMFGSKDVLEWESSREKMEKWLRESGLKTPRTYKEGDLVENLAIMKFPGAKGGRGYKLLPKGTLIEKIPKDGIVQEYVVGVPMYFHYFYSLVNKELEIMSIDRRYETNADAIPRIPADIQRSINVDISYVVVGNIPIVVRESLLPEIFEAGERIVEASWRLMKKGLYGPFCLEAVITPEMDIVFFEISTRIVAGTNFYINGSPYTWIKYNKPVSTGRRIAMEIKEALSKGILDNLLN